MVNKLYSDVLSSLQLLREYANRNNGYSKYDGYCTQTWKLIIAFHCFYLNKLTIHFTNRVCQVLRKKYEEQYVWIESFMLHIVLLLYWHFSFLFSQG